jgi:hypothetical protein
MSANFRRRIVGLIGTPVLVTTDGGPPCPIVGLATKIPSPSGISGLVVSGSTEVTSPFVNSSVRYNEGSSVVPGPKLTKVTSPSANSSVRYDKASSVVQCSERAEVRSPFVNTSARYDESSSVVPRLEHGDSTTLRASSLYWRRPSAVRL